MLVESYSMISELLCAITSGGATSNHHQRAPGQGAGTCHSFIVINPAIFGAPAKMKAHLSCFLQELRDAKRADPDVPIYTHGEKECLSCEKRMREGIEVNINTVAEMANICQVLGMDRREYLGDVDITGAKASTYDTLYYNAADSK